MTLGISAVGVAPAAEIGKSEPRRYLPPALQRLVNLTVFHFCTSQFIGAVEEFAGLFVAVILEQLADPMDDLEVRGLALGNRLDRQRAASYGVDFDQAGPLWDRERQQS